MVAVAVNVTGVLAQIVLCEGEMLTAGTTGNVTIMCTLELVAVVVERQLALLVITTHTESALCRFELE